MGKVLAFPSKEVEEVSEPTEPKDYQYKLIIGDEDWIVDQVKLPELKWVEWEVHTLSGDKRVPINTYWSSLGVVGPEQIGNAIQREFPLAKLSLEMIDPETEIVEHWWEFYEVFLSTRTEGEKFIILFRKIDERSKTA